VVTVSLPADQQNEVKVGNKVSVTLPDQSTTGGTISSVGTVATGSGSSAAIPVYVTLAHPSVAGRMDQAPVTVEITTASAPNALTVPVGALLARSSGGYAVEVTGSGGSTHLVPVQVGMFDDASGLVQVTGALAPGEHVVVPSS
jgi:multidrug efflux pump subunit AcrA (membrane-fusion protein)